MEDHFYNGIPVHKMPLEKVRSCLEGGVSYSDGDPTVAVSDEHWYWIKLRLEIELVRRSLGLPVRDEG